MGNERPFDWPGVDNNAEKPEFDMGAYESVLLGVTGDANGDACVNVLDLLAVRANLGKEGSEIDPMSTDINGDDKVNVLDLLAVRAGLGKGSGCAR